MLGFISVRPNGSKHHGYILLLDPHKVVKSLDLQEKLRAAWWGAYTKRATNVGCSLP
jgi:hypothetical protein